MKLLYSLSTCLLFLMTAHAQDADNDQQNKNWDNENYYKQHRPEFDAIIKLQREKWNEAAGYLVRSEGDTIRPYTRSQWMRDSILLENRNWDDLNAAWPASMAKGRIYQPGKNYKLDSARSNRAGRTQDRKFENVPGKSHSLEKDSYKKHSGQDFMYMKDDQLMVSRSGIKSKVMGSITLYDGSKVYSDGTIKLTNGSSMQLKKGERINLFEKQLEIIPTEK